MWGWGMVGAAAPSPSFDPDRPDYEIQGLRESVSINQIRRKAAEWRTPVKFFNDKGRLMGTVYPNGDVVI